MSTLFNILRDVLTDLGEVHSGTATGGSATTLVDSGFAGKEDDWKGGILFIDNTTDGLAPEEEYAEVTGYARNSGTFTVGTNALSASPGAGDDFSVSSPRFPMADMIRVINRALNDLGDIPKSDTSLSTSAGALEYSLPTAAKGRVKQIWLSQYSDSDAREQVPMLNWRISPDQSKLIFSAQPDSGQTIEVVYLGKHDPLWDYDDALEPFIDIDLVVKAAVFWTLKTWMRRVKGSSQQTADEYNEALREYEMAKKEWAKYRMIDGPPFKSLMTSESWPGGRTNRYGPWLPE